MIPRLVPRRRSRASLVMGLALLGAIGASAGSRPAEAAIVERVVAVVGDRPILLSELRQRARPHLFRIAVQTQNPTQQAAAENEMFRELLNRMIDERLEEQAADKAHLTVTPEEVDNGIRQVAQQNRLDPKAVVAEAKRSGMTEQDYRDEIRRQVIEGKLVQLRVRGRVRITDQDARSSYEHAVKEIAQQSPVDLRWIALQIAPGTTPERVAARMTLGQELARRAIGGEDFCQLVLNYSDDPATKASCGSRGPVPMAQLPPELQQLAAGLKVGETGAQPIQIRDQMGNNAILVVQKATDQGQIPPFEQVKEQMMDRAYLEATQRQLKLWLQELRRGVYIDVRL